MTVLVRIEGVNLGAVLDDTNDLSTRRGAGMMLLSAALNTKEWAGNEATAISSGASAALLTVADSDAAENALGEIRKQLAGCRRYSVCRSRALCFGSEPMAAATIAERFHCWV
jgi:hypothetical protein